MKIKIFESPVPENEEILLRLVKGGSGVSLVACDPQGRTITGGNILRISSSGRLFKFTSISPHFGLQVDDKGRIKEESI